jgi:hypothetical protein
VSYRDDLDAAHARIAALEAELAATKRKAETPPAPRTALATVARPSPTRGIHYHRPPSYFPMLRRFITAVPVAFARRPGLARSSSDNVLAYFARNYLARPLVFTLWMPIYCAALLFALPILAIIYIALSIVALPVVAVSCVSFSPEYKVPGWLEPETDDSTGVLFWLLMGPWCFLFLPAMIDEDDWPRR